MERIFLTKVNRTRSLAKKGMRSNGQTSNRPEERLAYNMLGTYLQGIENLEAQKRVDFNEVNYAIPDIYFTKYKTGQKYVVRLQGPPHDEKKAVRHDRLQYFYLIDLGYIVIDFVYTKMPFLFLRNERELTELELKEAHHEITRELSKFGLFMDQFKLKENDLQA